MKPTTDAGLMAAAPQTSEEPAATFVASFEIWPHRSLGRGGTALVLSAVAVACLSIVARAPSAAMLPLTAGAIVTVSALAVAFWSNNRSLRYCETIEVGPHALRVKRLGARGRVETLEFNTGWVRVALTHDRLAVNRLVLSESGRRCLIAECLSPGERVALAAEIGASIARARDPNGGASID